MKLLTIFTPTYNRAHLLPTVYQSLLAQDAKEFEWIVGDDGSTDSTSQLIQSYQQEGKIDIKYFSQKNSGKHIAFNNGVKRAEGKLFFNLDSDDKLVPGAIANILEQWRILEESGELETFAGMVGNKIYSNGSIVGTKVDYEILDTDIIDYRFVRAIQGDKMEIFKTEILKQFPFPENNERFCPEALVWNRIGSRYKFRFFNKALYQGEYLPGGLTEKIISIRKKSPNNTATYYAELTTYNISSVEKIKAGINYWRFCIYDKSTSLREKFSKINPVLALLTIPFGLIFALKEWNK